MYQRTRKSIIGGLSDAKNEVSEASEDKQNTRTCVFPSIWLVCAPTLSTKSCWMGSAAVAAAMYEVARFRLAQVLTKEAALSVELAVSMMEVVEWRPSEKRGH